jgi:ribosome-interacting GTPase 1
MPANLPPQYYEAEKAYRQARSPAEKAEALEAMLAIMPRHKGTEHLRGELRARLARLMEEGEHRSGATRSQLNTVRKEGAGQVALVGQTNAGKSRLLAALSGAAPKVGDYPYTTQLPFPAMAPYENVQIQLVDLPAIDEEASLPWMRSIVRQADLLLAVVSLGADPLAELESTVAELDAMHVEPVRPETAVPPHEPGQPLLRRLLVAANKLDLPDALETLDLLRLEVGDRYPIVGVSASEGAGLEELRRCLFGALRVIRVYTRAPGHQPDLAQPVVLPLDATVGDAAEEIHKELGAKLKYALLWGSSGKFGGQRVGRSHVLRDGDVVEFIASASG